ncbi:sensor histidine kinase [Nocardiopsis mangrovi]|uniref:histidine kinase n=1 Tax=Nocardiopsis mangrovi TaxID=1179818 RepID=A0ABV9E337_9ACTN
MTTTPAERAGGPAGPEGAGTHVPPAPGRFASVRWAWLTDALIVVVLAACNSALVSVVAAETGSVFGDAAAGHIGGALLALVLAARRYLPFTTLAVLMVSAFVFEHMHAFVWGTVSVGIAVAAYSVGRYLTLARSAVGLGAAVAVNAATTLASPVPTLGPVAFPWIDLVFLLSWMVGSWWLGRLVRMRAFHVAELRARAERLERARDAYARAALVEERARIARELHDVVAHHVSVMTVQATAGRRVIDRSPERARQTLAEIEGTGRQALAEMRRIVGVLRVPESAGADLGPQPGVAGLSDLAHQMGEAGVRVELRVSGEPVALPPGLDLTLYRVAQESLTNVLKHAGEGARATVALTFGARDVELTVEDDGSGGRAPGGPAVPSDEPGHGLLGMRERVALFGGELRTGAREGGGFRVGARLPVEAASGADRGPGCGPLPDR